MTRRRPAPCAGITWTSSFSGVARLLVAVLVVLAIGRPAPVQAGEDEAELMFLEGLELQEGGDCEAALEQYRTALREWRRFCRVRYYMAQCLIELGRPGEALMQAQETQRCAETDMERAEADSLTDQVRVALAGGSTTTEPDGADPDGADPDGADPDGADPDGADPDGSTGSDPDGADPDGEDPDGSSATEGTDPDGAGPDGTGPDDTGPDDTDPDDTDPDDTDPDNTLGAGTGTGTEAGTARVRKPFNPTPIGGVLIGAGGGLAGVGAALWISAANQSQTAYEEFDEEDWEEAVPRYNTGIALTVAGAATATVGIIIAAAASGRRGVWGRAPLILPTAAVVPSGREASIAFGIHGRFGAPHTPSGARPASGTSEEGR